MTAGAKRTMVSTWLWAADAVHNHLFKSGGTLSLCGRLRGINRTLHPAPPNFGEARFSYDCPDCAEKAGLRK